MNPTVTRVKTKVFDAIPHRALFAMLAYQYWLSEHELHHLRTLVPPDGLAVDVGAWWGPWTYWLSRRAKTVVTCEPVPHLAKFVEEVSPPNVRVLNVALSDSTGEAAFWLPVGGHGSEGRSSLESPNEAQVRTQSLVQTTTMDDLDLGPVGFIKIDVEGHEMPVLRGAHQTIDQHRPTIVIEAEERFPGDETISEVFDFMKSFGYTGRFLLHGKWHALDDFDLDLHQRRYTQQLLRSGYLYATTVVKRNYVNNFVFTQGIPQ